MLLMSPKHPTSTLISAPPQDLTISGDLHWKPVLSALLTHYSYTKIYKNFIISCKFYLKNLLFNMSTYLVKQLLNNAPTNTRVSKEIRDAYLRSVAADPGKHLPLLIANASSAMKATFDYGKKKEFGQIKDGLIDSLISESKAPATGFNINSIHFQNANDGAVNFDRSLIIDNAAIGKSSFHIRNGKSIDLPLAPKGYSYHGANHYLTPQKLIEIADEKNLADIIRYKALATSGKTSLNPDKIYTDEENLLKHLEAVRFRVKNAALEKYPTPLQKEAGAIKNTLLNIKSTAFKVRRDRLSKF